MVRDVPGLTEYRADLLKSLGQRFKLGPRVIDAKRCPRGGRHTVAVHHRLATMMAGAHRDAFLVKDGADIVRMNAFQGKAENGSLVACRADQSKPRYTAQ